MPSNAERLAQKPDGCDCERCHEHNVCVGCQRGIDERESRYYVPSTVMVDMFTGESDTIGPLCEACRFAK